MFKSSKTKAYRCVTVILSAILVIASLSMTGCALKSLIPNKNSTDNNTVVQPGNTDQNNSQDMGSGDKEPEENKPVLPSYYNPLTGLAAVADLSGVRPVAISLQNGVPVFGIGNAEILVEAPVENDETRTVMITTAYTGMLQLGAIGTTRPYLLSVASDFAAVSICAGTNDIRPGVNYPAYPTLNHETDGPTTVFFKQQDDAAGLLYTSGTRLIGALENFEKRSAALPFSFIAYGNTFVPTDKKATGVIIPYSGTSITQFLYDSEQKQYFRSGNAAMHIDAATGEQIGFTNLLLLTCESSVYNKVTGTEFELDTQSGGSGYYITEGRAMEITWLRDENGTLVLRDKSGHTFQFNRGKTYIGMLDIAKQNSLLIVE